MLDELRQADWLPRNVRKNLRRIEATITPLEQKLGRAPREQELAEALGMSLDEYQTMLQESRGYQLLHYEDFQESEDSDFFDVYVAANQTAPARRAGRQSLPPISGAGHQRAARAREDRHGPVLRAGDEPQGNRRGARRVGIARVSAPRPGGGAPAQPAEGVDAQELSRSPRVV